MTSIKLNTSDNASKYGQLETVSGAIRNIDYVFMNSWVKRATIVKFIGPNRVHALCINERNGHY